RKRRTERRGAVGVPTRAPPRFGRGGALLTWGRPKEAVIVVDKWVTEAGTPRAYHGNRVAPLRESSVIEKQKMKVVETIPLHETARARYLNYALSVITSRALPDIRDGL